MTDEEQTEQPIEEVPEPELEEPIEAQDFGTDFLGVSADWQEPSFW